MIKNRKKLILFGLFILISVGLIYYIFNGGKVENGANDDQVQSTVSEVKSSDSTAQVLQSEESLSMFYSSIEKAGLTSKLDEQITVFAPNNKAFENIPEGSTLTDDLNADIVNYHLVRGIFKVTDLSDKQKLPTLNGQDLVIMVDGEDKYVVDAKGNKAKILSADLTTSTGVIHEIDKVLLPQ